MDLDSWGKISNKKLYFKYKLQVIQFFKQNPKYCSFPTANFKS